MIRNPVVDVTRHAAFFEGTLGNSAVWFFCQVVVL
jgi:hypothetical protein